MLLYQKIFRTSDQLCRDFPKKLVSFTRNVVSRRAAIRSCHCHPVKACFWNFWSLDAVYIRKFLMCESKGRSITLRFVGGCYRQLPAQALWHPTFPRQSNKSQKRFDLLWGNTKWSAANLTRACCCCHCPSQVQETHVPGGRAWLWPAQITGSEQRGHSSAAHPLRPRVPPVGAVPRAAKAGGFSQPGVSCASKIHWAGTGRKGERQGGAQRACCSRNVFWWEKGR